LSAYCRPSSELHLELVSRQIDSSSFRPVFPLRVCTRVQPTVQQSCRCNSCVAFSRATSPVRSVRTEIPTHCPFFAKFPVISSRRSTAIPVYAIRRTYRDAVAIKLSLLSLLSRAITSYVDPSLSAPPPKEPRAETVTGPFS
jgi:hypothetical protein